MAYDFKIPMDYAYGTYNGRPTSSYQQSNNFWDNQGYTNNYNQEQTLYNQIAKDNAGSFFDEYLNGLGDYIKQNPIAPFSAVGSLWNTWNNYNNNKKALALARDNYNLQKQAYLDNEARNKEAFNWQRQQRLSAQL